MAWVEDEGDEGGGEQHFDDANMALLFGDDLVGSEDSVERIGVENAITS